MHQYIVSFQAQARKAPEDKVLLSYIVSQLGARASLMPPWALSFLEDAISCGTKPDIALCMPYKLKLSPDYLLYELL